jgi:hypothetical protein
MYGTNLAQQGAKYTAGYLHDEHRVVDAEAHVTYASLCHANAPGVANVIEPCSILMLKDLCCNVQTGGFVR